MAPTPVLTLVLVLTLTLGLTPGPVASTLPSFFTQSKVFWQRAAIESRFQMSSVTTQDSAIALAIAVNMTRGTSQFSSIPMERARSDALGPQWIEWDDMVTAAFPAAPDATANPLDWFRAPATSGPVTPGGRAATGRRAGRAAPSVSLMLGLDALTSLSTGRQPTPAALANATLLTSKTVKVALTPFRFRNSTRVANATTVFDTIATKNSSRRGPELATLQPADVNMATPWGASDVDAGWTEAPDGSELFNRQMRRRMKRLDPGHDVPWPYPFWGEEVTWSAVRAFVHTWVVAYIGDRLRNATAAAGAPDYLLDPGRYNDTSRVPRPRTPPPPKTYVWFPVEYCTGEDSFSFTVQEWTGVTSGATATVASIQTAHLAAIPADNLFNSFHTKFHRVVGVSEDTHIPKPWEGMYFKTRAVYEDCEFQGQGTSKCSLPKVTPAYSVALAKEPHWRGAQRCWGAKCEAWRYPSSPWISAVPGGACTWNRTCNAKGKSCVVNFLTPNTVPVPYQAERPRFADPYTREGLAPQDGLVAFPPKFFDPVKRAFSGPDRDFQDLDTREEREAYKCFTTPKTFSDTFMGPDWGFTFYHMYAAAQGVPLAPTTSETGLWGPASGFKGTPDVLPLLQSLPNYPITTQDIWQAANTLGLSRPYTFPTSASSLNKDWCDQDAAAGFGPCKPAPTGPGVPATASMQEVEWGLWRNRIAGVNSSIMAAATALRTALEKHIFSPHAYGMATVCGGPGSVGYLACGASPPSPSSALLQATCAPGGTCLYGLPPEVPPWTCSRCKVDRQAPEGPCVPDPTKGPGFAGFDLSIDQRAPLAAATAATNTLKRKAAVTPPGTFPGDSTPTSAVKTALSVPVVDPISGTLLCAAGMGGPDCGTPCGDLTDGANMPTTTMDPAVGNRTSCRPLVLSTGERTPGCYNDVPTVTGPLRRGCSGHGVCFSPASPDVCVCDAGWAGPFCSACAYGRWGPACEASCIGEDPGASAADFDAESQEVRVWDPTRSTGVFNLSTCLSSATWRQYTGPRDLFRGTAPRTVAALADACALWSPAATSEQWLARARTCLLNAPSAPGGVIPLGALCDFEPRDCVKKTLFNTYKALGVTPQSLFGCPSDADWATHRPRWTSPAWAAATATSTVSTVYPGVVTGPTGLPYAIRPDPTEFYLQSTVDRIRALGIARDGTSARSYMRANGTADQVLNASNCGDPRTWGARPGRLRTLTTACDPWVLMHPNVLALVDDVGVMSDIPFAGAPASPSVPAPWPSGAGSALSGGPGASDTSQDYLCDPIAFRWEMEARTGVDPAVGLNPVMWGVCPPEKVKPRWLAPGAAVLCGDAEFFAGGPGSPRARHLGRLGGWDRWTWSTHAARGAPRPRALFPLGDPHPADGAWIRTLLATGARAALRNSVDAFATWETGYIYNSTLWYFLNQTGPHYLWNATIKDWRTDANGDLVPNLACGMDCQVWVGMGIPTYKESPELGTVLVPLAAFINRVATAVRAATTPAAKDALVATLGPDIWALVRGLAALPTNASGYPIDTDYTQLPTMSPQQQFVGLVFSEPRTPCPYTTANAARCRKPWDTQGSRDALVGATSRAATLATLAGFNTSAMHDTSPKNALWRTLIEWVPTIDAYVNDTGSVADHGPCSVLNGTATSANCSLFPEVLWGPVGQYLAAIFSDTPGLPMQGLTLAPGTLPGTTAPTTLEPSIMMTACIPTATGPQCGPYGAQNTMVFSGISPESELGCPGALTGRSPSFSVPDLGPPVSVSPDAAARARAMSVLAALNTGPEALTLCDWTLFLAANPLDFAFDSDFWNEDSGLVLPSPDTLWGLVSKVVTLFWDSTAGSTTAATVPPGNATGPWNATWTVTPMAPVPVNDTRQRALASLMDTYLGLSGFLSVGSLDAIKALQDALVALVNRTMDTGCLNGGAGASGVWAYTRVNVPVARTRTRVCGGPTRAATCGPAPPGSPGAAACTGAGFLPCSGGNPPPGSTMFCKCGNTTGCACAPGSNLDPVTRCMTCLPGTLPLTFPLVSCGTLTPCPVVQGARCSGRGTCIVSGKAPNGTAVARPFNGATVAADTRNWTLLAVTCACGPGWAGDACTVPVPTPPAAVRLTASARNASDPGALAAPKGTPTFCPATGLFVALTSLHTYWAQCDVEALFSQAAAQECRRSVREVCGRPFYWAYGARTFAPRLSTIRAVVQTDIEACDAAGGTIASLDDISAGGQLGATLYSRVWHGDMEGWPPTASLTPVEVEWVNTQGGAADFAAVPTITNASFCIRLQTPQGLATFLAPVADTLVRGTMVPQRGTALYPVTPGWPQAPDSDTAEVCTLWAPPLCALRQCPAGGSRSPPGSFFFA